VQSLNLKNHQTKYKRIDVFQEKTRLQLSSYQTPKHKTLKGRHNHSMDSIVEIAQPNALHINYYYQKLHPLSGLENLTM
jgi:hypothetical protein